MLVLYSPTYLGWTSLETYQIVRHYRECKHTLHILSQIHLQHLYKKKYRDVVKLYVDLSKPCQAIRHTVKVSVFLQQPMCPSFYLDYKVLFCA
jgi:hypothetical protein